MDAASSDQSAAPFPDDTGTFGDASIAEPGRVKVDILLVVDDSASMTEEQTSLAGRFNEVTTALGAFSGKNGAKLDYRIALTTTGRTQNYKSIRASPSFPPSRSRRRATTAGSGCRCARTVYTFETSAVSTERGGRAPHHRRRLDSFLRRHGRNDDPHADIEAPRADGPTQFGGAIAESSSMRALVSKGPPGSGRREVVRARAVVKKPSKIRSAVSVLRLRSGVSGGAAAWVRSTLGAGPKSRRCTRWCKATNGKRAFSQDVVLTRASAVRIEPKLETSGQRVASLSMLGVGVVSLVGGAVFGVDALAAEGDAKDIESRGAGSNISRDDLETHNSAIDRRDAFRTVSIVGISAGAALVIGGGLLYVFDKPSTSVVPPRTHEPTPTPRKEPGMELGVYPLVSPTVAGAGFGARF